MWIIALPATPIIIAVICIALGLFGEIQSSLGTINSLLNVLVVLAFGGICLYNFTRFISPTKKVLGSIACVLLGAVSKAVLSLFIRSLGEIEFGLFGLLEFALVFFLGGSITLLVVLGCIMACTWFSE